MNKINFENYIKFLHNEQTFIRNDPNKSNLTYLPKNAQSNVLTPGNSPESRKNKNISSFKRKKFLTISIKKINKASKINGEESDVNFDDISIDYNDYNEKRQTKSFVSEKKTNPQGWTSKVGFFEIKSERVF